MLDPLEKSKLESEQSLASINQAEFDSQYEAILSGIEEIIPHIEALEKTSPYIYKTILWSFSSGFDTCMPLLDQEIIAFLSQAQETVAKHLLSTPQKKELDDLFAKEIKLQQEEISREVLHDE